MPVLYLIGSATPPVTQCEKGIKLAQDEGWTVCLVLTPSAATWRAADLDGLEKLTGYPVRSQYKMYGEPDVLPPADAMLAAPVGLNTLAKWALGIPDTLALGLLTEAIGKKLPLVALPYLNNAQADHPAFAGHIAVLEAAGVNVMLGDGGHTPHGPGQGNKDAFAWHNAISQLPTI